MFKSSKISDFPANTVILHCPGRGKTVVSVSPFALKLETYLRMANIPYEIDTKKPFGSDGKTPWITLNGTTLSDSQLIIEFLNVKFGKDFWENATVEQKALVRIIRILIEEHFSWGFIQWRWVTGVNSVDQWLNIPPFKFRLLKLLFPRRTKKNLYIQGFGRHSLETCVKMASDDLRNVSTLLGSKRFILGDVPTEGDCALFGMLANVLWATPGSPYEKLIMDELPNLKDYCERMRDKFWPDWADLLVKAPGETTRANNST